MKEKGGLQPIDILILVEHVDRELDVACLIKAIIGAEAPKLKVRVANFYTEAQHLMATIAPKVVVTPFLYAAEDMVMRDYVADWPRSAFVNMAWEQILYGSQQALKRPRDDFTRNGARHLAWSPWFRDYLAGHGVAPENIHWLGHPLYDLYEPDLRGYFMDRSALARRHGLDAGKPWVFFPENFRWAFLGDKKLCQLSEQGVDRDDLEAQRAYCRDSLAAAGQWLAALARQGKYESILRPRPAVNTAQLRAFVKEHVGEIPPNLRILKQHSVREWIFASDLIVSSISTSLIEGAIAGKPILRASPRPVPPSLWYDWCASVPVVETEGDFLAAVGGPPDMTGTESVRAWAKVSFKVGARPTEQIARLLVALATQAAIKGGESQSPPARSAARWLRKAVPLLPPRLRHSIRLRYEPGYFFSYETHEKDLFGDFEVERRAKAWRRVLEKARPGKAA